MVRIYRDSDGKTVGSSHTFQEQAEAWKYIIIAVTVLIFHLYTPLGWILPFLSEAQNWLPRFIESVLDEFKLEGIETAGPRILEVWLTIFYSGFYITSLIIGNFKASLPPNAFWFLTLTGSLILSLAQIYGWYLAWKKFPLVTISIYVFPLALALLQIFAMWLFK